MERIKRSFPLKLFLNNHVSLWELREVNRYISRAKCRFKVEKSGTYIGHYV